MINIDMCVQVYPVGTMVRLSCDDYDDDPREVVGYKQISGSAYLIFKDGTAAHVNTVICDENNYCGQKQSKNK